MLLPGANVIIGIIMCFVDLVFAGVIGFLFGALLFKVHRVLIQKTRTWQKSVTGARMKRPWWLQSRHFFFIGATIGAVVTLYAFAGPTYSIFVGGN